MLETIGWPTTKHVTLAKPEMAHQQRASSVLERLDSLVFYPRYKRSQAFYGAFRAGCREYFQRSGNLHKRYFTACSSHDCLSGRDVEFTVCWYLVLSSAVSLIADREKSIRAEREPCPPLAREAGTSRYPVRSVSQRKIDASIYLSRRLR